MDNHDICAVIPCLNPDDAFLRTIDDLQDAGFSHIIVVDDGSRGDLQSYFDRAQEKGCTVLHHHVNLGKGRAMKTAFNHYLGDTRGCCGVVTLDADGQHRTEDAAACGQRMRLHPDVMVLGCRDFDKPHVPRKSRVGNKVMRAVFRLFCGITLSDTQTGLHAIPNGILPTLLTVQGEGFEYETNLLLELKRQGVAFEEVPIETVYINHNASTHFRPLRDVLRIGRIILKFLVSSLFCTLLDFVLFTLLTVILSGAVSPVWSVFVATAGARIMSSLCNYTINKNLVFRGSKKKTTILRYYTVAAVQMFLSFAGVYGLTLLGVPSVAAKIPVDLILFFISFFVQREWVFR